MKYTDEMIEKARLAKTPDELLEKSKENGIEMTAEEARKNFELMQPKSGEIADEELDNVAGGGCGGGGNDDRPKPRFKIGSTVWYYVPFFDKKDEYKGQITGRTYEDGVWMYKIDLHYDIPEKQIKYEA